MAIWFTALNTNAHASTTDGTAELREKNDNKQLWWNGGIITFKLVTANYSLTALNSCSLLDKSCSAHCILNKVKKLDS